MAVSDEARVAKRPFQVGLTGLQRPSVLGWIARLRSPVCGAMVAATCCGGKQTSIPQAAGIKYANFQVTKEPVVLQAVVTHDVGNVRMGLQEQLASCDAVARHYHRNTGRPPTARGNAHRPHRGDWRLRPQWVTG